MTTEPHTAARPQLVALPGPAPRIDGLVVRRVELDRDMPGLAAMIVTTNLHDGVDWMPTAANLRHELEHNPGMDPARDVLVAEVGGEIVGSVMTDWRIRGQRVFHAVEPTVRPDHRHRGLGRALVAWVEQHVAEAVAAGRAGPPDRPHVYAAWADLEIAEVAPFAAAAGYHVEGYGVMMTRSLAEPIPEVPLPEGLEVRLVRPEDHRRIWDADSEAFRDHRDPAERVDGDFERWFSQDELDTSLWDVAWDGDEVAGSVMTFIWPEENAKIGKRRGWLEHVSVRRPWRKRGLASALMVRSMQRLKDLGFEEAALGADAENLSGAVRLYESLGFRRVRTAASYRKALEPDAAPR